jgi:hypothetical protein
MLQMAKHNEFYDTVFLLYSFTVLLLRALMHEFARNSQAIIHVTALLIKRFNFSTSKFEA